MRIPSSSSRRLAAVGAATVIAVAGIAAVALAAGGATSSKAPKVKVKCPTTVLSGKKVTCRLFGRLPRGPRGSQGPQGPKGQKGQKGAKGDTGARGPAGVSGYATVTQTFKAVFVENSGGGQRGLSEVKTVSCAAGKRVIGGGTNLGTNVAQSEQQRSVSVSLSGPNSAGTGWSAQLFNNETSGPGTSIDLQVYAICANAN